MSRLTRSLVVAATTLALAAGPLGGAGEASAAPASSGSAASGSASAEQAAKPRRAKVTVVLTTPRGVPASVRLVGKTRTVVRKTAAGTSAKVRTRLAPGRYRVKVDDVVLKGVTYAAAPHRSRIRVSAHGRTGPLRIKLRKVRSLGLTTTSLSAESVGLTWRASGKAKVVLRRAAGSVAPRSRHAGKRVGVRKNRATDHLTPGATYSYALFVKRKHGGWVRDAVTVGVPTADGSTPSYSLAPAAVLGSDRDTVTVSGGVASVRLAPGRPTPPVGAGFVLPPSAALPGGFLGTVASVSADGRSVALSPGGLADVFASLDLQRAITEEPIELSAVTDPAVARARVASYNAALAQQPSGKDGQRQRLQRRESCLQTSLSHQLSALRPILRPKGHWNSGIKDKWGIPYAATFDFSVALETGVQMDLETEFSVACALPLTKVVKQLSAYPVPITMVLEPTVEVSVSGAVKLHDVQATITNGFWAKGQIGLGPAFASGPINDGRVTAPTMIGPSGAVTVKLGGSLTIGPGVGTDLAGVVAGVNGYFNPLVSELKVIGAASPTNPAGCVSFQSRLEVGAGLEAKAWAGKFTWSASWHPDALNYTHNWHDPWYFPTDCEKEPIAGTGDVQATLTWNSAADLDLHVTDPSGEEIYYGHETSESGGALDLDANAGCETVLVRPTENVYWPAGQAPSGDYTIQVVNWSSCDDPDLSWHLIVRVNGIVVLDQRGSDTSDAYVVTR